MKASTIMLLAILSVLSACASPARNLIDQQIYDLSDDQLCAYKNNYRSEARTEAEIARRNLNCDRHYRACLKRGIQPGSEAMAYCVDLSRENERLRSEPAYSHFDMFGYRDYDRLRSVSNRR